MLLVDRRIGSEDLAPHLEGLGLPVYRDEEKKLPTLPFGDVAFVGRGEKDRPVPIGVEIKTLGDLLSSMTSGRLTGHQLPGLVADFEQVWILVEGIYHIGADGSLETLRGGSWTPVELGTRRYMWRDLQAFLLTLQIKAEVRVVATSSRKETARWLAALYHWWTDKSFEEHRGHLALHRKASGPAGALVPPSLIRRIAAELPGIGWERSGDVSNAFANLRILANATEAEWQQIKGIGKTLARNLVNVIGG